MAKDATGKGLFKGRRKVDDEGERPNARDLLRVRDEMDREVSSNRNHILGIRRSVAEQTKVLVEEIEKLRQELARRPENADLDKVKDDVDDQASLLQETRTALPAALEKQDARIAKLEQETAKQVERATQKASKDMDRALDRATKARKKDEAKLRKDIEAQLARHDKAMDKAADKHAKAVEKAVGGVEKVVGRVEKGLAGHSADIQSLRDGQKSLGDQDKQAADQIKRLEAGLLEADKKAQAARASADELHAGLDSLRNTTDLDRRTLDELTGSVSALEESKVDRAALQELEARLAGTRDQISEREQLMAQFVRDTEARLEVIETHTGNLQEFMTGGHAEMSGRVGAAVFMRDVVGDVLRRSRWYVGLAVVLIGGLVASFALGWAGLETPGWFSIHQAFAAATGAVIVLAVTLIGIIIALADGVRTIRQKGDAVASGHQRAGADAEQARAGNQPEQAPVENDED